MDQFEQQIEMMDLVFMRMIKSCKSKCLPAPSSYADGDVRKGEAVCIKRCGAKLFQAVELVSMELQQQQQQK